ncbi:MAG TPA: hypothetical protein VGN00_07295 [Puia sp.]|jgi:hypothetical protein
MNHLHSQRTTLLIAFAVETLSVTWLLKFPGWAPFLSIPYFASGIVLSCLLLYFPALRLPRFNRQKLADPITLYRLVTIGLIGLVLYTWCRYWFEEMPIDIYNADMLPIIKVMGQRFIAGQHSHIYDTIPWIWHGVQPIYLPTMWQPYVPAIAMGIDMRWVLAACLLFSFGAFVVLYRPQGHRYLSFFTAVLAFLLFWWLVADNTPGLVSVAEEATVIAYYVLLVLALVSGKPWQIGIAASLCLLSRYALVGWIPAYVLYLLLEKNGRSLLWFGLTSIVCFVLFFLLPVGWDTFLRLARLPGDYVAFAARVWKDSPDVFSTAPGFAWFFGPHKIGMLHRLLITFSFSAPLLFVIFYYWKFRGSRRSAPANGPTSATRPASASTPANLPLATLKLTLVVFYCFIDVPYLYLFYTSSFVSLIAVTLLLRERDNASPNA